MSIVAVEPPVLSTETTCVALPTELANQAVAAPLTGASTRDPQIRHAAAHSETSSRRMDSMVRRRQPRGQVKFSNQLGHRAVTNPLREGRKTKRHNRKYKYPSDQPASTSDGWCTFSATLAIPTSSTHSAASAIATRPAHRLIVAAGSSAGRGTRPSPRARAPKETT